MFNISSDFILRQVRIVLFWVSGVLVSKGVIDGSMAEWIVGGALQVVVWAWSLWGNRIVAKVNELVKMNNFIVIAPPEVANAVADPSAVSNEEVKVTVAPGAAATLKLANPQTHIEPGKT